MKATLIAATTFAVCIGSLAQDPDSTSRPATPTTNSVASMPEPEASLMVPMVRAPGTPVLPAAQVGEPASGPAESTAEVGWSRDTVDLRTAPSIGPRTNAPISARGVLPKARPERKGIGGFFAGVANLFNPFAPMDRGVSTAPDHWYDSQINPAAVTRAHRDERYHEPKTELIVVGIDPPTPPPAPEPKD